MICEKKGMLRVSQCSSIRSNQLATEQGFVLTDKDSKFVSSLEPKSTELGASSSHQVLHLRTFPRG
jgi:hypothetical protein